VRDILVTGVSTRKYRRVLPAMAGTVGIAKSSVSRKFIQVRIPTQVERDFRRIVNDDPTMLNAVSGGC
jgi:hypothetical protein